MFCPFCDRKLGVIDSRLVNGQSAIRRRRKCEGCGARFTTYERFQHQDAPSDPPPATVRIPFLGAIR